MKPHSDHLVESPDIHTDSDSYAGRFKGAIGDWILERQRNIVLSQMGKLPIKNVLEIGGGHCQIAKEICDAGYKLTILGSAPASNPGLLQLLSDQRLSYVEGSLLELPFEDGQFDALISLRQLSHIKDWECFIAECCRVASQVVIVDYAPIRSFNILAPVLFPLKKLIEGNTRHYRCFSDTTLKQAFSKKHYVPKERVPQFFLPLAFYRALGRAGISRYLEAGFSRLGLTYAFGSPVIMSFIQEAVEMGIL